MLSQRLTAFLQLIRWDKPVGTWLLLWPTLTALWIAADGHPSGSILLSFCLGTFLCRSAGCCLNDLADQDIDGYIARTKDRPLITGRLTPHDAWLASLILLLLAFFCIAWLPTRIWWMAAVAALLMATYPLMKRFFPIPQAYLGICFSFGIPMAYAAVQKPFTREGLTMFIANCLWTVAYDTVYAMVDRADDQQINIHSSALFFGRWDLFFVALLGFTTLILWVEVGLLIHARPLFFGGLLGAFALMLYFFERIRTRNRGACFFAFTRSHWVGFVILISTIANYRQ